MDKMISKFITPGNKVEIQTIVSKNEQEACEKRVYISKVYDVLSDERIEVLMPIEKTKLILLPVDMEYEFFFYTANGLYQCMGRIVDRYKDNNIYVLAIDFTSNLRKYQRREYYRFSCALEMNSRELIEEEMVALDQKKMEFQPGLPLKRSVIVDISGGGLRFMSNHYYERDSLILCKYHLLIKEQLKEYNLTGKVLDVKPVDSRPGVYEHRVQYINMSMVEREEIIRYIFTEERKNRQKELR